MKQLTTSNSELPTYAQMRRTDLVLLSISHRYRVLMDTQFMHVSTPSRFGLCSKHHPTTYHHDRNVALMEALSGILDEVVERCVVLVLEGKMQLPADKRSVYTKVKDFFKRVIFKLPHPVEVRIRQGVRNAIAMQEAID